MRHVTNQPTSSDLEVLRHRLHSICIFHGAAMRLADESLRAAMDEYRRSLEQMPEREAA